MFKLINFFDFPHLNQLRHEMSAPLAKAFGTANEIILLDEEAIRLLGSEGIEVNIDEIKPLKNKTLGYKGQRVLVYIRDVNQYREKNEIWLPKFHISYCQTLENMRENGRWARYVVANKDDGFFNIRINNHAPEFIKLKVCQCCLENLRWNDFSRSGMTSNEKKIAVDQFSIEDFFRKFPKSLFSITPTHTSDTAPVNEYTPDWPEISENIKKERGYKCENVTCEIKMSISDRKSLHVHHINGLKCDNTKSNLQVLCIRCHANEPYHSHMKGKYYHEFIDKYC